MVLFFNQSFPNFPLGVRSPTSVVVQLGYSVVIALLKSDFSLATVLQSGCRLAVVLLFLHSSFRLVAFSFSFCCCLTFCSLVYVLQQPFLTQSGCIFATVFSFDSISQNFFCPTAMWLQTCFGISYVLSCSRPAVSLQSCINLAPVLFSGHDIYLSATLQWSCQSMAQDLQQSRQVFLLSCPLN